MSLDRHQEIPSTANRPRMQPAATTCRSIRSIHSQQSNPVDGHENRHPRNQVIVMFEDSAPSFMAPQDATLAQIADRIDELGTAHEQPAVAVIVKFAATPAQASVQEEGNSFLQGMLAELPRLRAFAISLARNRDRADDLVQGTLTKAWAHRSRFQDGTNLQAWLMTILRNSYFSQSRSSRREISDSDGSYAAKLVSPAAQLHHIEFQDLTRIIDGLTEEHRQALFLVALSGVSYHDAAAIGDCAIGTIKSRVFRAREILRRKLDADGPMQPCSPAVWNKRRGRVAAARRTGFKVE